MNFSERKTVQQNHRKQSAQSGGAIQCVSSGGNYSCSTCQFRNAKYHKSHKLGYIQKVCHSSTTVVEKKVSHAEWAISIVMVRTPNGRIGLGSNFKVTVNSVLTFIPLPKPEELFHALNGGSKFSKLDLTEAYLLIELD